MNIPSISIDPESIKKIAVHTLQSEVFPEKIFYGYQQSVYHEIQKLDQNDSKLYHLKDLAQTIRFCADNAIALSYPNVSVKEAKMAEAHAMCILSGIEGSIQTILSTMGMCAAYIKKQAVFLEDKGFFVGFLPERCTNAMTTFLDSRYNLKQKKTAYEKIKEEIKNMESMNVSKPKEEHEKNIFAEIKDTMELCKNLMDSL